MKIVTVEDVTKSFGTSVQALAGVSLELDPGIIYGLLGPNGADKTTLIRVLATLLRPDAGAVQVGGIDVLADPTAARRKIGLAGQSAAVDQFLTGRENVTMVGRLYGYSAAAARRRADEVLERIDLAADADRPVRTYSGGMRRRLDLAASMVGRPEVLFLDEPTTGIDPRSRIDVWNLITDLVDGGTTILLTTQYLDEADQLAHRIGVIDQGRLISEGTPNELKDTLGGSVIELHVAKHQRVAAVTALTAATGEAPTAEGDRLAVSAPEGPRTLLEVVRRLDADGVVPQDVALRKPTLDDVFLALTGHHAEEAGAGSGNGRRNRPRRSA